jgi:hypothetical protein
MLDAGRILADQQLAGVVDNAKHATAATAQARFPDARDPLVGADEHDHHREWIVASARNR